jgi:hypothetical protein
VAISHKRETNARRTIRKLKAPYIAGGMAVLATLSTVGVGVVASNPDTRDLLVANSSRSIAKTDASDTAEVLLERQPVVSRSLRRIVPEESWEDLLEKKAVVQAVRAADDKLWTTAPLNLWTTPGDDADKRGILTEFEKVLVTGREAAGRVELVVDGQARWVTSGYLTDENPNAVEESGGLAANRVTKATCTNGTSVPSGVSPNIAAVHQSVCANFPEISTYGTFRDDGEHAQGIAVDIMASGARGQEVADFVRANYAELGVNYLIHAQQIWSVDRASEGWRYMEDRGSVTANHYDHVHVTTYW